jgi:MFS family permease
LSSSLSNFLSLIAQQAGWLDGQLPSSFSQNWLEWGLERQSAVAAVQFFLLLLASLFQYVFSAQCSVGAGWIGDRWGRRRLGWPLP